MLLAIKISSSRSGISSSAIQKFTAEVCSGTQQDSWQVLSLSIGGVKLASYLRTGKPTEVVSSGLWAEMSAFL